jgi:hypothetical protein
MAPVVEACLESMRPEVLSSNPTNISAKEKKKKNPDTKMLSD